MTMMKGFQNRLHAIGIKLAIRYQYITLMHLPDVAHLHGALDDDIIFCKAIF